VPPLAGRQGGFLAPVWLLATVLFGLVGQRVWGSDAPWSESHRYIEVTGAQRSWFAWRLEAREQVVEISAEGEDEVSHCRCDRSGAFSAWRVDGPGRSLAAVREGRTIILTGTTQGKTVDLRIAIDDAPWFQALSYSLRSFVHADTQTIDFWILRPDDLTAVKMRAVRKDTERVALDGGMVEALRVRISPVGLIARLWHGDYWYRLSDGVLVLYRGVHGLPGTPRTEIRLQAATPGGPDRGNDAPASGQ